MANVTNINQGWLYLPDDVPGAESVEFDDSTWTRASIPHTNKLFPHHGFDDMEYQFVSWYRKVISIPNAEPGDRAFLDFDGVMLACEVFVNGVRVTEHKGGYLPFSVEITHIVEPGSTSVIAVRVDSRELPDIPPYGGQTDFMTFGGIYRDVRLRLCGKSYIKDVFAKGIDVLTAPKLEADVEIDAPADGQTVTVTILDIQGEPLSERVNQVSGPLTRVKIDDLSSIKLWSIDDPNLYNVRVELKDSTGRTLDSHAVRFGFRDARFCEDGAFRLNGKPMKLTGLNRHQTFPYIGGAAPERLQRRDADVLKYDLALNIVRTSHYPQSPHFLDRCDEIGLLVFEEIAGWAFIGDEAWQAYIKRDVHDMVIRDRNHPSIILWGVRVNESDDNHDLYTATNAIARELDPTRQTGGVRAIGQDREFLEDVYTYNDYGDPMIDPPHIPYLLTEFGWPLLSAKTFDNDERKIQHALVFARTQSLQMLDNRYSGAIGWAAFDYNTHNIFSAGDRIDYFGVCDIFRLPKPAAYFYASQADPSEKIVLFAATNWARWDRPLEGMDSLVVFSNCESVKIYAGDVFKGEFAPSFDQFPGLKHPPYMITGLGSMFNDWGDLLVEGYVGGVKIGEMMRPANSVPVALKLWADSDELIADGRDMTALNFQIVEKYGNPTPYTSEIVTITSDGPVDIIGTNPFAPQGGQGAVYLKAREQPGQAIVRASTPRLGTREVLVTVKEGAGSK